MNCEHGLIFNYGDGTSVCGECGEQIITLKDGSKISLSDLITYFEENAVRSI